MGQASWPVIYGLFALATWEVFITKLGSLRLRGCHADSKHELRFCLDPGAFLYMSLFCIKRVSDCKKRRRDLPRIGLHHEI